MIRPPPRSTRTAPLLPYTALFRVRAALRATDFHDLGARRTATEIRVEGDDAVDVGTAQVQRLGDMRNRRVVDEAELLLQRVQERQQTRRLRSMTARQTVNRLSEVSLCVAWQIGSASGRERVV